MAEQWNLQRQCQHRAFQEELLNDEVEDRFIYNRVREQHMELIEYLEDPTQAGGSRSGRAANIDRRTGFFGDHLYNDYFADNHVFPKARFRWRYRMSRALFLRIMHKVMAYDDYFVQKRDALGVEDLSSYQKCTAALRMFAYGTTVDATDQYCRLGESTTMQCLKRFEVGVRACFESEYLREPTSDDIQKQMEINEARGFPGMFGSIDCMHYH